MCGICGIVHDDPSRPVSRGDLERMMRRLRHRGPDDEGIIVDGHAGFGHLRLSIVDLSPAGHQPMSNEDGRLSIVLNGEIYNYRELREQLAARGHRFRSQTDTEVVLHLYEDLGAGCVEKLNGMFAFAIWDSREKTVFAARDRFGIKPFYYVLVDGTFAFASEIKALLALPAVRAEMDYAGVADYLTLQFCLGDKTMFRHVRKLMPAHFLRVRPGGALDVQRYWALDFTADFDRSEDEVHERLSDLLTDAVRLELQADVPVGVHLSGGLDSTTVAVLASKLADAPLHSFSGGFLAPPGYDETGYARIASAAAGTIHGEVYATPEDFVELMPSLVRAMDEPAAGPGLFPQFLVSRLARQHVKVVLGGQGGDEVFGGYTRYLVAYLDACLKGGIDGTYEQGDYVVTFESILPNLKQLRGYEPMLQRLWREGLFGPADLRYFQLITRTGRTRESIAPEFWNALHVDHSPFEEFRALFNGPNCHALINRMTYFDIQTLLPSLLQVEDRASMAVSLETRVPLLDHRIVELMASTPPRHKYKGAASKYALREAVREWVPAPIWNRSDKMGFPVPLTEWCRHEPVRGFVRDLLCDSTARSHGILRPEATQDLLSADSDHNRGLWGLINLELWMRSYLDNG